MNKQHISVIIFFGALWGLLEATLGYILQFLPPLISGSIMFPIGATILIYVYKNTENKSSILWVSLIAASIKAINFLMPGLPPIKTYNPMIAIMLQSIAMIAILPLFNQKPLGFKILSLGIASLLWRSLFIINISINHALSQFPFPQLVSNTKIIEFIVLYGLMGALFVGLIFGILYIFNRSLQFKFRPSYVLSILLLIVSFAATYFL